MVELFSTYSCLMFISMGAGLLQSSGHWSDFEAIQCNLLYVDSAESAHLS